MTQTYYMKDADGEYFVAQPQPTLREMEPGDVDDTMSIAERVVRIVLAKARGVCLSKVHAIDHAGNSYLREASATQCANAIGALNIQPLIDQVHGILSLPTQPEPPADVAREADMIDFRDDDSDQHVAQFIDFLASVIGKAVAAEREACAKLCEQRKIITPEWQLDQHYNQGASHCAAAIRARGEKGQS